jgi:hypothetical protein
MSSRHFYLRLMLISLATVAIGGAASILFIHGDATMRVVGTALLTAVASALMIPASTATALPDHKPASNLAMSIIVLEFILTIFVIWFPPDDTVLDLGMTIFVIFVTAVPAVIFLGTMRQPAMVLATPVGLSLCTISLILFLIATWMPVNTTAYNNWPLWRSAWLFYLFALLTSCALVGLDPSNPATFWRLIGVIVGAAAFWRSFYTNFNFSRVGPGPDFAACENLAILIAYISLALPVPLRKGQTWVRHAAIYSVAATAFLLTFNSSMPPTGGVEPLLLDRLTSAAGILAGCGTLALLVLSQINQSAIEDKALSDIHQITIICPRCRRKSTLALGRSACPKCGLQLVLGIGGCPDANPH